MEMLNLVQGTSEWHAFRADHKMASETPALCGVSPWAPKTPLQLYEVKRGIRETYENKAMRHGKDWENLARLWVSEEFDKEFTPVVVLAEDGFAASLDGITVDERILCEIKIPFKGRASMLWEALERGDQMPENYYLQVQHQLMVSGAEEAIFAVYDPESDAGIIEQVAPDPDAFARIRAAWADFWPLYEALTPPPAEDGDHIRERSVDWAGAAEAYLAAKKAEAAAEAAVKDARDRLMALAGDRSVVGSGVRITRYFRRGTVQYSKIPELKGVDLNQYRKEGSFSSRISEVKNDE